MISVDQFVELDPVETRFFSKVNFLTESGCWQWMRPLDSGYGRFARDGKTLLAHRVSLEFCGRPVPDGMQADHLCRNRGCVNPDHIESVTLAENVLRGEGVTARNARATECPVGHEYNTLNTYITPSGTRDCKPCQRERVRKWRARQKREGK